MCPEFNGQTHFQRFAGPAAASWKYQSHSDSIVRFIVNYASEARPTWAASVLKEMQCRTIAAS